MGANVILAPLFAAGGTIGSRLANRVQRLEMTSYAMTEAAIVPVADAVVGQPATNDLRMRQNYGGRLVRIPHGGRQGRDQFAPNSRHPELHGKAAAAFHARCDHDGGVALAYARAIRGLLDKLAMTAAASQ